MKNCFKTKTCLKTFVLKHAHISSYLVCYGSSSTYSTREPLGISKVWFLWARCPSVTQPSVSHHWRKRKTL